MRSLVLFVTLIANCNTEYRSWSPTWMARDDLECEESCWEDNRDRYLVAGVDPIDDCCTCKSRPTWLRSTLPLYIEYVSIVGKSVVIPYGKFNTASVYSIEYTHQELKYLPSNLCHSNFERRLESLIENINIKQFWKSIVKLDFSHNEVKETINFNCLSRLDTLDLRFNRLSHLSNTSFQNLTFLRELYLENNQIKTMDATIVSAPSLSLQRVDISNNKLTELDVTNFMSLRPFCYIDYNSNEVTGLKNPTGFKLNTSRTYGPGQVEIRDNKIATFPDFQELFQIDSLAEMGNLINFGFDFRDVPLICDCNLEPFMGMAKELIDALWRNYMNVNCDGPPELAGTSIKQFTDRKNHDKLICDLSNTRECSRYSCTCINQPSSNTLFVNCSGRNLTELPELPSTKFSSSINLDLSNNNIKEIANTSYLKHVSHLSLAHNDIMVIHEDAALMLENASIIDLSNNENLRVIPPVIQYRPNGSIVLNNLTITCDCDSTWIQGSKFHDDNNFICRVPNHGDMEPAQFSKDMLDCDTKSNFLIVLSILLGLGIVLLMIAGGMSYWLRYEILIFLIRCKQAANNTVNPVLMYDAFLSFDDDDDDLRNWINTTLVPYLQQANYKIFVPLRDLTFGDSRENNTLNVFNRTKNLLVVLSESYTITEQKSWLQHEWKYGWNMFKRDRNKNIVMINFDQILTSEMNQPQLKAFLRIGGPIDFSNTKRNILEQICEKLGPPISTLKYDTKPIVNKKVFTAWQLFEAKDAVGKQDIAIKCKHHNEQSIVDLYPDPENDKISETLGPAFDVTSDQPNCLVTLCDANFEQLVTEKQRPAFGKYNYYV